MARVVSAGLIAVELIGLSGHAGWFIGEMALAWSLHAACLLAIAIPFARSRRYFAAGAAAITAAIVPWLPVWAEPRATLALHPRLVAMTANTYHHNPAIAEVARRIESSGAELVALTEPDLAVFTLLPSYRRAAAHNSGDKYGIALLVRASVIVDRAQVIRFPWSPSPLIEADIQYEERPLRVYAVHVLAPTSAEQGGQRDLQVAELMKRVESSTRSVVVLGDLNMVMTFPLWRALREGDRLRRPPGETPGTWPWQLGGAGLPLDHVLVSPDLEARPAEVVDLTCSDHRGVLVRIGW